MKTTDARQTSLFENCEKTVTPTRERVKVDSSSIGLRSRLDTPQKWRTGGHGRATHTHSPWLIACIRSRSIWRRGTSHRLSHPDAECAIPPKRFGYHVTQMVSWRRLSMQLEVMHGPGGRNGYIEAFGRHSALDYLRSIIVSPGPCPRLVRYVRTL